MKLATYIPMVIILALFLTVIISSEIIKNQKTIPEKVFIRVLDANEYPDNSADCKAYITTKTSEQYDVKLENVKLLDYLPAGIFSTIQDQGYYKLETGLTKKDKEFEIGIVCINAAQTGVSHTIINESSMNCEVKGGYLIC